MITSHYNIPVDINFEIRNNILQRVSTTIYPGLIINEKLKFNHRVDFTCKKLSRIIGIIPIYSGYPHLFLSSTTLTLYTQRKEMLK